MGKTVKEEAEVVEQEVVAAEAPTDTDDAATLPDPVEDEDSEANPVDVDEDQADFGEEPVDEEPALHPEAKRALEQEYPVLREHGSHNAAMKGLQTSPGYDPTKL